MARSSCPEASAATPRACCTEPKQVMPRLPIIGRCAYGRSSSWARAATSASSSRYAASTMPFIVTSQLLEAGSAARSLPHSAASALAAWGRSPLSAAATASAATAELSTADSTGECTRSCSMGSSSVSRPWYQRIVTSWAADHHAWSASPAAAPRLAQTAASASASSNRPALMASITSMALATKPTARWSCWPR